MQTAVPTTVDSNALFDALFAFERGELDDDATLDLFQALVDSGMVWSLQGAYGRMAQRLLDAGLIQPPQATADA